MAKLKSKSSWFKGKAEIQPPSPEKGLPEGMRADQPEVRNADHPEVGGSVTNKARDGGLRSQEERIEEVTLPEGRKENAQEGRVEDLPEGRNTPKKSGRPRLGVKGKKRGQNRQVQTLGGIKKQARALKRKLKKELNKKMGLAGFPASSKSKRKETIRKASPISVLFMDNTKGGLLSRKLQEADNRLSLMTNYRVRVVESAGTALSRLLPSTNPWGTGDCGRQDCITCKQQDDPIQNCKKRSILYENRCVVCNVDVKEGTEMKDGEGRGVYVGESSRSIYERAKEHQHDRETQAEDSHQIKHWILDHPDMSTPPKFKFKIIQSFMDPLSRQLAEAVRIERRGLEILNSKSEFSRCRVPRLVINLEEWKTKSKEKDTIADKADTGSNTATEADEEDEALIKALEETEKETRRKEGNWKEGKGKERGGRQPKRRK